MVTRHEFLEQIHLALKPRTYVEVGVQHGYSLTLAHAAELSIGIDPDMSNLSVNVSHATLMPMTADDYFANVTLDGIGAGIDFGFIDGMHLVEFALRDFMNMERYSGKRAVIVFDDVSARSQAEANRVQCPGDWVGDAWKVFDVLSLLRPDLTLTLVDTEPTGCLMVTHLNPNSTVLRDRYDHIHRIWARDIPVPGYVLNRDGAVTAEQALRVAEART